ncbi:hypothetical protein ACIFOE_05000 [Paenibacillus sp. NRS-1783]|uniref:hypothetical protein n=1 Tax=Paenibacillus sp. NRS-1783 TaxID=3233907 RepID=UPI003D2975D7
MDYELSEDGNVQLFNEFLQHQLYSPRRCNASLLVLKTSTSKLQGKTGEGKCHSMGDKELAHILQLPDDPKEFHAAMKEGVSQYREDHPSFAIVLQQLIDRKKN